MSLLDDLGAYAQTQGLGTLGSTLFLADLVESTSTGTTAAILESPASRPPTRTMTSTVGVQAVRLEWPRVQVQARGATAVLARNKATQALSIFDNLGPIVLGGVRYEKVLALFRPVRFLRRDANEREIYYIEFEIAKEPSS